MELAPLQDKVLICAQCGEEFVFTVSAQQYFLEKGFVEEPRRCKHCYTQLKKDKRQQDKNGRGRPLREQPAVDAPEAAPDEGQLDSGATEPEPSAEQGQ
jgi:hypothetical protein